MKNRKMSQNSQCVQIGFVVSADISQLPFVVISLIFLAMEHGTEENVIIVLRALSSSGILSVEKVTPGV